MREDSRCLIMSNVKLLKYQTAGPHDLATYRLLIIGVVWATRQCRRRGPTEIYRVRRDRKTIEAALAQDQLAWSNV